MKKRMMLIINPMAGRSGYKTGFGEVMNILDSGGYLTTVYFTQGRGDATVFAAQHAAEYDTVACIGGDGTLSEVVSGLMQVPNPPPLGYIPMGTTNDVASTLGLPKNATDAALRIVTGTPTAFNVGSFGDKSFFTYVAAFGAFTAVSYETPQNEKQALGHLAYVLEAMSRLNSIDQRIEFLSIHLGPSVSRRTRYASQPAPRSACPQTNGIRGGLQRQSQSVGGCQRRWSRRRRWRKVGPLGHRPKGREHC